MIEFKLARRAIVKAGSFALAGGVLAALGLTLGCRRAENKLNAAAAGGDIDPGVPVILYCSIDAGVLDPLLAQFTRETGIRVDVAGDTEATKTIGLVQRILSERARPRADLWLSSEAVGTVRLAREGVLLPLAETPTGVSAAGAARLRAALDAWPTPWRRDQWVELAVRPRVVVFNTRDNLAAELPSFLHLADPSFRGRIALARARFGSTRGHVAALKVILGTEKFSAFARALAQNAPRICTGNGGVVLAVSRGECTVGVTDCDDIAAGIREGWPVGYATVRDAGALIGTPSTLALVRGAPNPRGAALLAAWLLEGALERALAGGDWRATPIVASARSALAPPPPRTEPWRPAPAPLDWTAIEAGAEEALQEWEATVEA
ncbi:N/A [soil metagenome]